MNRALAALGALFLLAGSAWAQGSIVIYPKATGGKDAQLVADYLENKVMSGLFDQYPCFDVATTDSLKATLDAAHQRELLTGELDDSFWKDVAGTFDAQYIIILSATTMGNGQIYVSASAVDTKTASPVAKNDEPPASGDKALDAAEALAKSFVQALSSLKAQCEPHWTGSVIYTYQETRKATTTQTFTTQKGKDTGHTETMDAWDTNEVVEALLMPIKMGSKDTNLPGAKIIHNYVHRDSHTMKKSDYVVCRAPGQNPVVRGWQGEHGDSYFEQGKDQFSGTVSVVVDHGQGTYEISFSARDLPTTFSREDHGNEPGLCGEKQTGAGNMDVSGGGIGSKPGRTVSVTDNLASSDPTTLRGRERRENGDGENEIKTVEITSWELHLVKPKSKH